MKIIHSQLQKLLPGLKTSPQQTANDLTLLGHFCAGLEKKQKEEIIDLEIRQNRADCLGYYGIAKELSVLHRLPLSLAQYPQQKFKTNPVPITVTSQNGVQRLLACTLNQVKNSPSPPWLAKLLTLHDINPINYLVDLTNYIMIYWGLPCHAFDQGKIPSGLIWEDSTRSQSFTTLDGTVLNLDLNTLQIKSDSNIVSLTFIGGKNSKVDLDSSDILIEMAVYDPARVRHDSRQYKTITEASIRLDKFLDPNLIPLAFSHLISLIETHCQGQISSDLFDFYPKPTQALPITFHPEKVNLFAGISIPKKFSLTTLKSLDCQIKKQKNYSVTPPTFRSDLNIEEDLIEEVIRFWGYQHIPTNKPISSRKFKDITPPLVYFIEHIQKILISLGYDEIRSWPLISEKQAPKNKKGLVYTENNINNHFPILRHSLLPSLENQVYQYQRFKVHPVQIFEIGKVYYQNKKGFQEKYQLGLYQPNLSILDKNLRELFKSLKIKPSCPNLNISPPISPYLEIDLEKLIKFAPAKLTKTPTFPTPPQTKSYELKKQIITLDANLILKEKKDQEKLLKTYTRKIGERNLWSLSITDIYHDPQTKKYKYSFRASYFNLSSAQAKKIHLKSFNLV